MLSKKLAIIDGVRTPFTKMGTALASCDAAELGRIAVSALLSRTGIDPAIVSEVIMGCVAQPADAANIARVIALRAGIPEAVPAMTVHRNCASGMEAITTAAAKALAGQGEVFIVGGTESMSQIPFFYSPGAVKKFAALNRAGTGARKVRALSQFRPADFAPVIGLKLGLTDPVAGINMGQTAEILAREFDISRQEQDRFALLSHQKATVAAEDIQEEIVPVFCPGGRGGFVAEDNGVRPGQSLEALQKLRPVFDRKTGSVTAGNASQITDGAVALLVMTKEMAMSLGLTPLGYLSRFNYVGCEPKRMGLGPVFALKQLAENTGITPDKADLIEINEAFAVQVLAVTQALKDAGLPADADKLNPNGGSIAIGHPVGATGARLILTALKQLKRSGGKRALVSLCIGGGQGGAALLERI